MKMRGITARKSLVSIVLVMAMILFVACGTKKEAVEESVKPAASTAAAATDAPKATEAPVSEKPLEKVKLKAIMHASWAKDGLTAVLKDAAEKVGIELEIEKVPEGSDGDNLIKTRFATHDL